MMEIHWMSYSPKDTRKLGRTLGNILVGGDVVSLIGELGSGKTALVQGIGEALGVGVPMTSPTFTLIQEYVGQVRDGGAVRVLHMDLYRLAHPEEAEVIGVADSFQEDAVVLIEWPEMARDILPEERLEILIEGSGDMPRGFTLQASSDEWAKRWPDLTGGLL